MSSPRWAPPPLSAHLMYPSQPLALDLSDIAAWILGPKCICPLAISIPISLLHNIQHTLDFHVWIAATSSSERAWVGGEGTRKGQFTKITGTVEITRRNKRPCFHITFILSNTSGLLLLTYTLQRGCFSCHAPFIPKLMCASHLVWALNSFANALLKTYNNKQSSWTDVKLVSEVIFRLKCV